MRAGTDILRAGSANPDSTELRDVIIFRRDDDGLLREQIYAETASLAGDRWNLDKVVIYYRGALTPRQTRQPRLFRRHEAGRGRRALGCTGRNVLARSELLHRECRLRHPSDMGLRDLVAQACLAVLFRPPDDCSGHPAGQRFRRGGGLGVLFAVGVGLGFIYFVVDGMAVTMGELGFVTPWLAAWVPAIGFGALAVVLTLRAEKV